MPFKYQPQWQGPLSGRSFEKQTEDFLNGIESRVDEIDTRQTPSDAIPMAPGVGSAGTSDEYSRGDHSHPLQSSVSGNAGTADALSEAREISISGEGSGSAYFSGATNVSIPLTVACIADGSTERRQIASRFADVVNVKDFGAKGDGLTDDTDAINAALEAGGYVYMPEGTYIITESISIPSNTYLIGAGKGVTVIKADPSMDLFYHTICTSNAVDFHARGAFNNDVDTKCPYYVERAGVYDLTVDGNAYNRVDEIRYTDEYSGEEPGTNIEFQRCRYCEIINVEAINGPQHNINIRAGAGGYNKGIDYIPKYPSQYCTIAHCNTDNQMRDDGITTHHSEYIYIYDCQVFLTRNTDGTNTSPVSNGIEIDDGSRYVLVEGCLSDGGIAGYQAKGHANTHPACYIWFSRCIAKNVHNGFSIAHGTEVDFDIYENASHDIYIDNCCIENVYQKSGITSYATECHYIVIQNSKNIYVTNLTVNGKTAELPDYSSLEREARFRFQGKCQNIVFDNVFLTNVDDNTSGTERALFGFEGNCINMQLSDVYCDKFTTGQLIRVANGSARPVFRNVWLKSGSSSYPVAWSSNSENVEAQNIRYSSSKCAVLLNGSFIMPSQKMSEDRIFTCALSSSNSWTNFPISLNASIPIDAANIPDASSLKLPFMFQNVDGSRRSIGEICCITKGQSSKDSPGNSGSFYGFYVRDTNDSLVRSFEVASDAVAPPSARDNLESLGRSDARFSVVYAGTGSISTSDERFKTAVTDPDSALMRAWGRVRFKVFQFTDSVEEKGRDKARLHVGVVAQSVRDAFASEGLDANNYGLFCYDKWDNVYENELVVDSEAVLDEHGIEVEPAKTHVEHRLVKPSGDLYGIRYDEALALECAYQRWRIEKLEARIAALEVNPS